MPRPLSSMGRYRSSMPNLAASGTRAERYIREPQLDISCEAYASSFPSLVSKVCPCGSWAWWLWFYPQWQCPCFYPIRGYPGGSCKSRTSTRRPDYGAEWIECQVCRLCTMSVCCHQVLRNLHFTNSSQECNPFPRCPVVEGQWYTPLPPRLLFSRERKKK